MPPKQFSTSIRTTQQHDARQLASTGTRTVPSQTMTSREMAELTEKRHDSVKRTIDTLVERGAIGVPQIVEYLDSVGRPAKEYRICKRDSYVIVAQLSPEFTARLVDRWQELEAQALSPANQSEWLAALPGCWSETLAWTLATSAASWKHWQSCRIGGSWGRRMPPTRRSRAPARGTDLTVVRIGFKACNGSCPPFKASDNLLTAFLKGIYGRQRNRWAVWRAVEAGRTSRQGSQHGSLLGQDRGHPRSVAADSHHTCAAARDQTYDR